MLLHQFVTNATRQHVNGLASRFPPTGLQALRPLHGGGHLRVRGQLSGALHQVQLLQHHPHLREQCRSNGLLDLHLRTEENLLQCDLQGECRDSTGAGQGEGRGKNGKQSPVFWGGINLLPSGRL